MEVPRNLALGIDVDVPRTSVEFRLAPGSALCLFTDGLLEMRRDQDPGSVVGMLASRLADLDPAESADLQCSRLLADTIGVQANLDDIALLLIRRTA